jgi:protein involved in polysaccharide export with SLBB domain
VVRHAATGRRGVAVLLALAGLAGCASEQYPVPALPPKAEAPAYYAPPVEAEYRLQIGDALTIRSYFDSQLNQDVVVRPDGRISVLLIGDIDAAGLTPAELSRRIRDSYARLVGGTDVTAALARSAGANIYLSGEIKTPALQPMDGDITLLQAIARAGGFLPTANTGYVLLIRSQVGGKLAVSRIDVEKILRNESPDVYLHRRDVVYVPKSDIAQLNQFVDQYINNIVPRAIQVQFGWFQTRTNTANPVLQVTPQ